MVIKSSSPLNRPGVVLLVVISLLALFAAVGLSFVFYAENEANAAKMNREQGSQPRADVDPEQLLAFFLGQLIYDVPDIVDLSTPTPSNNPTNIPLPSGLYSAMRGHSLARNMYGYEPTAPSPTALNPTAVAVNPKTFPFSGVGRLHFNDTTLPAPWNLLDRFTMVNHTYFPADGFILDPERLGSRLNYPYNPPIYPPIIPPGSTLLTYPTAPYAGCNGPYTYPDGQNLFLGAMDASGNIITPSWRSGIATPNLPFAPGNKYQSFRPDPFLNPIFGMLEKPLDTGGDVKNVDSGRPNWPQTQGVNNDSIWMDLGFPVLTAPDGKKYKPLFASFIIDLDGKVNLNAAGNIRATGNAHASNMGLGPWEINISQLQPDPTKKAEFANLIKGNGTLQGRYGMNGLPGVGPANPLLTANNPKYFGPVDVDGVKDDNSLSGKYFLPGDPLTLNPTPPPGFFAFPDFFPNLPNISYGTYGGSATNELLNHASLYNIFNPKYNNADDLVFPASDVEACLRYLGTGSPGLTSNFFRLCPVNFADQKIRRMVTSHSMDVGRPGASPWLPPLPYGNPSVSYQLNNPLYPLGQAILFPSVPAPTPGSGEFGRAGWDYYRPALRRINLNRKLTDYPGPDPTGRITDLTKFATAQTDRQNLAKDIFDMLRLVTSGHGPWLPPYTPYPTDSNGFPDKNTNKADYDALRWLAQLAVNIVDFRDSDDYITPFNWNPSDPTEYVYGTELPRLVINEVYTEAVNDPTDGATATKPYNVNFWVELLNPLAADLSLTDQLTGQKSIARFKMPGTNPYPIYKLAISQSGPNPFVDNNLGSPANVKLEITDYTPAVNTATPYEYVLPANQSYSGTQGKNEGFFVIGPENVSFPGGSVTESLQIKTNGTNSLGGPNSPYTFPINTDLSKGIPSHNLFLRRLACPDLEEQSSPNLPYPAAKPYFNPYVTVDFVQNIKTWDAIGVDQTGPNKFLDKAKNSYGRKQPYAADSSQIVPQTPSSQASPENTFFSHNSLPQNGGPPTLSLPFNWLVHLNRDFASPMELMHVSMFPPHKLTQQFMTGTQPFAHLSMPIWFDVDPTTNTNLGEWTPPQSARIFRAFEFFDVGIRGAATDVYGRDLNNPPFAYNSPKYDRPGRVAGKININTVWDPEVFLALCDPQTVNSFTPAQVQTIFSNLVNSRQIQGPFKGMAPGVFLSNDSQFPNGGIKDTFLRPFPSNSTNRLFDFNPTLHPFQRTELMSKIFNNVTTRSNVFAIWLTAGFFEVTDGPLSINNGGVISNVVSGNVVGAPGVTTIFPISPPPPASSLPAMAGNINGTPWAITPNCCVWVGDEPVLVTSVTATSFTANFTKPHAAYEPISMKGVLGTEVGKSEGRNVRHRMFAIVDRSALSIPADLKVTTSQINVPSTYPPPDVSFMVSQMQGIASIDYPGDSQKITPSPTPGNGPWGPSLKVDYTWQFKDGMRIRIFDSATKQSEEVTITVSGPNTLKAAFVCPKGVPYGATTSRIFLAGVPGVVPGGWGTALGSVPLDFPGSIMGNPGPQPRFDHRQNTALVLHYSIIQ